MSHEKQGAHKESLEQKLSKRMGQLNQGNEQIANGLLEHGFSEHALARFVGMHNAINRLADVAAGESNHLDGEKFLISINETLAGIVEMLEKNSKWAVHNIANNPDLLKQKILAALEEITTIDPKN